LGLDDDDRSTIGSGRRSSNSTRRTGRATGRRRTGFNATGLGSVTADPSSGIVYGDSGSSSGGSCDSGSSAGGGADGGC
jgi:hypothetical protein